MDCPPKLGRTELKQLEREGGTRWLQHLSWVRSIGCWAMGQRARGDFSIVEGRQTLPLAVGQAGGEGGCDCVWQFDTVAAHTSAGGGGGGASWVFAEAVTHDDPLSLTYTTDANVCLVGGGGGGGQRNATRWCGDIRASCKFDTVDHHRVHCSTIMDGLVEPAITGSGWGCVIRDKWRLGGGSPARDSAACGVPSYPI